MRKQPAKSWAARPWLILSALLALVTAAAGYTMSDRATLATVRPYPKLADIEAEACTGAAPDLLRDDEQAGNGKVVLLSSTTNQPRLSFHQQLEKSTYALWVIARSTGKPTGYREPMYIELKLVGPDGTQQWRMRVNYMDSMFQDIAHLYFDIRTPGQYELTVGLGAGSRFDLLVDRFELRDVLAGTFKRGFKTEPTVYLNPAPVDEKIAPFDQAEALRRARAIAGSFPPRNSIKAGGGMDKEGFYKEFSLDRAGFAEPTAGRWVWKLNDDLEAPWAFAGPIPQVRDEMDQLLDDTKTKRPNSLAGSNPKLKVPAKALASFGVPPKGHADINWAEAPAGETGTYTAADYAKFIAAPSRWPDDGGGYFIDADSFNLKHNLYFNWMAVGFKQRMMALRDRAVELAERWYRDGDRQAAFRAAVLLAHWADHFPSLDYTVQSTMQTTWGTYPFNTFSGRSAGEFGKLDYSGWAGDNNLPLVHAYDKLFNFIRDNELLAQALGQDIPGIRTPADVVELIDVKLLQHFYDVADRRQVRFGPGLRCDPLIAVVQGANEAGLHMLRQIAFVSDFDHPALVDSLTVRHSRDNTSFIGSMFYAKEPAISAGVSVGDLWRFAHTHKLPEFDLTQPIHGSSLRQSANWLIEPFCTGIHIPGVGDVSGPDGYPTMEVGEPEESRRALLTAWQRYGDPRWAWLLQQVYGFGPAMDDQVRAAVAAAAQQVNRDPRLNQPSRALAGFGVTLLEMHGDAPDFRDRAGVVLRTGYGSGHSHADDLNIEMFAKGIVVVPEFGGRPGYGEPSTTAPESHCLVTVDGQTPGQSRTHWLAHPLDTGCAVTAGSVGQIQRLIALIDAGPGDAYLFDLTHARGGRERTYYFHGNQPEMIDPNKTAQASSRKAGDEFLDDLDAALAEDAKSVWKWNEHVFSHNLRPADQGVIKRAYQAVWPIKREAEQAMFSRIAGLYRFPGKQTPTLYDPRRGKVFTRLLMPGGVGRSVKQFMATSRQVGYRIPCIAISEQQDDPQTVSAFAAVVEPFAGPAFITSYTALPVDAAEAAHAQALRVVLRQKRQDVLVGALTETETLQVAGEQPLTVRGRFGMVSREGSQLRSAMLTHGTQLTAGDVELTLPTAAHTAVIAQVDHLARQVTLDRAWPASLVVGQFAQFGRDGELFRIAAAEQRDGVTVLTYEKSARSYQSALYQVNQNRGALGLLEPEHLQRFGYLTTEDHQRGWRLEQCGASNIRWLGLGFRGGAKLLTTDLSDADVPDADGDGRRTLTLGKNDDWTEPMQIEVLSVFSPKRVVVFRPLNSPAGYAGSRSYAGSPIINEQGKFLGTAGIPGKLAEYRVGESEQLSEADFPDADGDGQRKFFVYYFGPGDPVVLPTFASVQRAADGAWQVRANTPLTARLPGQAARELTENEVKP